MAAARLLLAGHAGRHADAALPGVHARAHRLHRADDDIHCTLVGLGILESVGPGFIWIDVARYWTRDLPYAAICTAETQANLNFWNRTGRAPHLPGTDAGDWPE